MSEDIRKMIDKVKNFKQSINENSINQNFPSIGETISIEDLDYNMMDYFNRTNRRLVLTMKNGEKITTDAAKFYNDLVFFSKNGQEISKNDILNIKIIG